MRRFQALINHEHEHSATHETELLHLKCGPKQDNFQGPYVQFTSRLTDVTIIDVWAILEEVRGAVVHKHEPRP